LVGERRQRVEGVPTGVPLEYLAAEDGSELVFPDVRYGAADRNPARGDAGPRRTGLPARTYEMRWAFARARQTGAEPFVLGPGSPYFTLQSPIHERWPHAA